MLLMCCAEAGRNQAEADKPYSPLFFTRLARRGRGVYDALASLAETRPVWRLAWN